MLLGTPPAMAAANEGSPVNRFGAIFPETVPLYFYFWWPGADQFAKRIKTDECNESARRARTGLNRFESIEPPTRGFSERHVFGSISIYQLVTGASVAQYAAQCTTSARKIHARMRVNKVGCL